MVNKKGLQVIILGGTIDFELNLSNLSKSINVDQLTPRNKSIIPPFFKDRVRYPNNKINFSRVALKDSRDLNKEDYEKLLNEIKSSPYTQILITMGVINMENVVNFLKKQKLPGKVIGLVGSHTPLFTYKSDAGFHLGFATAQMQIRKPGIHLFHPNANKKTILKILKDTVFLITGGTIDSKFSEFANTEIPHEHSQIPLYFKESLGVILDEPDLIFHEVCMKDSRQLSEEQIKKLIIKSESLSHKNQIITGGTYALTDLGNRYAYLLKNGKLSGNKYLFIGAMIPEDVYYPDGWFNVGYAVGKINNIDSGVSIAMHGWTTRPSNIMKQLHEAKFILYDEKLKL